MLMLQIGNLILRNTCMEDVFKKVSGIIGVIMLFFLLSSCKLSEIPFIGDVKIDDIDNTSSITSEFEMNLSSIIENDLHNKFYVNYPVEVETDLNKIKIYIGCKSAANKNEIKSYILNKYCTKNDEVILTNEAAD